jgi:hypothetical protein
MHVTGPLHPHILPPPLHNNQQSTNKEQYFLWYQIFLPFYLPMSSLLRKPLLGVTATALWIATQALWLQQGFQLEFNGISTFVPGLWISSILFFLTNTWILGIIVNDIGSQGKVGDGKRDAEGRRQGEYRHKSNPMRRVEHVAPVGK